jgi:serine/threonine-protein kinase
MNVLEESVPDFVVSDAGAVVETGLPERIGKYRIDSIIGKGAAGIVYKAYDPFVCRDVAVKVALNRPKSLEAGEPPPVNERTFFAEAHAAGMLQHPHIVTLYDAGEENGLPYLVMEYVNGDTLSALCNPYQPRTSVDRVIDIVYKCAKALHYAHEKGVLHRDIKPSNIMITHDGVPKIMDFSIATITHKSRTRETACVGSPLYMSPEQIRRTPMGPQTDLYSLGAVMYQLLAGTPPYSGATLPELFVAIRNAPVPRLEAKRPDLPRAIGDLVAKLLAKDPRERYQTGGELAHDLLRQFERLRADDQQLSRRENRDSLRALRFFAGFTESEIEEILNASTLQTFAPGATIITEGEIDSAFFIIARGSVEVLKGQRKLHVLEKGDCFGEISFLSASRRTATVRALGPVMVLKVNAALMDTMSMQAQLHFYKVFAETLIYRLSMTSAKLSAAGPT